MRHHGHEEPANTTGNPSNQAECPACEWTGSAAYLPDHISQAHGDDR